MSGGALTIPEEAFRDRLRVRSYEVGRSGTIGLGTALRYCEALATDASAALGFDRSWYEAHHTAWVVREMNILLGSLPRIGAELRLATWVSEFRRVQAQREYAIWQAASGQMVARASARWAYCDALRGQPIRIANVILQRMQSLGNSLSGRRSPDSPAAGSLSPAEAPIAGTSSAFLLKAREYETDTQQHINNCIYADWLVEALAETSSSAAHDEAPAAPLRPRFYTIEYIRAVVAGDSLRIETQLIPRGTHGVRAWQTIFDQKSTTPVVRAYSEHIQLSPHPTLDSLRD
jgi:acyl-CoA thioesterase FadM